MKSLSKIVAMLLLSTLTASAAVPAQAGVQLPLRTQVQAFHGDGSKRSSVRRQQRNTLSTAWN